MGKTKQKTPPYETPKAVVRRFAELHTRADLSDAERALLDRLESENIWARRSKKFEGKEDKIIEWIFQAFKIYQIFEPPHPNANTTTAAREKWAALRNNQPGDQRHTRADRGFPPLLQRPESVAKSLQSALEYMCQLKGDMEYRWPALWLGDKSVTPQQALEIVAGLCVFLHGLDKEWQNIQDFIGRYIPKRWDGETAWHISFDKYLEARIKEHCGDSHPHYEWIADLEQVTFDLSKPPSANTVTAPTPAITSPFWTAYWQACS